MFDFEKLDVYQHAKKFNAQTRKILSSPKINRVYRDQLTRASLSVVLNLAEGTGRFSNRDKRHFYVMSRSSIFECVAVLDILKDNEEITTESYQSQYKRADELSRILFKLIRNLEK